ncbi:MAG: hypothetical protein ACRD88_04495 [Terriglobia bacterium]
MKTRSPQYGFFATNEDLVSVIRPVELSYPLQYIRCGLFDEPERMVFPSIASIPNLGVAKFGDSNLEPTFLVLHRGQALKVRKVAQRKGGYKYAIDQQENPGTISISPGGRFGDSVLIAGMVGTVHHDMISEDLLKAFASEFKKRFVRIKSYLVGPEARELLHLGVRLTHCAEAPRTFDLLLRI